MIFIILISKPFSSFLLVDFYCIHSCMSVHKLVICPIAWDRL